MKRLLLLILPSLLCIPGQAQEAFNRGFEGKNKVFIPGGSLGIGLSAAYSNNTVGDAAEGYTVALTETMLRPLHNPCLYTQNPLHTIRDALVLFFQ